MSMTVIHAVVGLLIMAVFVVNMLPFHGTVYTSDLTPYGHLGFPKFWLLRTMLLALVPGKMEETHSSLSLTE